MGGCFCTLKFVENADAAVCTAEEHRVGFLCGEKDSANLKSAHFLAQHIQQAELQELDHTGHVVNEENPKILAERLNEFYRRNF